MKNIVIIAGAASGIGFATAVQFSMNGWKVIGLDKNQFKNNKEIFEETFILDIGDEKSLTDVCEVIEKRYPVIDSVVLCAAVQFIRPFNALSSEEWDYTYGVNVKSMWLISKLLLDTLKVSKAPTIVAVSSIHAVATSSGLAAYASSKAALVGLVRSLAIEMAPYKIRVNAVVPGAVNTPMLSDHLTPSQIAKLANKQLLQRIAEPEEIASAIKFFSSKDSSYITGQYLIVDGGAQMLLATETE